MVVLNKKLSSKYSLYILLQKLVFKIMNKSHCTKFILLLKLLSPAIGRRWGDGCDNGWKMVRGRGGGEVVRRWGSPPLKLTLGRCSPLKLSLLWGRSPPELCPQVLLAVVRPLGLDQPLLVVVCGGVRLLLAARLLLLSLTRRRCERALPHQG